MLHCLFADVVAEAAKDEKDTDILLVKLIGGAVGIAGGLFTYLTARNNSRVTQLMDHVNDCDRDRNELRARCDRLETESRARDEQDRAELQRQIDLSTHERAALRAELEELKKANSTKDKS